MRGAVKERIQGALFSFCSLYVTFAPRSRIGCSRYCEIILLPYIPWAFVGIAETNIFSWQLLEYVIYLYLQDRLCRSELAGANCYSRSQSKLVGSHPWCRGDKHLQRCALNYTASVENRSSQLIWAGRIRSEKVSNKNLSCLVLFSLLIFNLTYI